MAQDTTPPHSSTTVTSPSLSDQQADLYQATTMADKTTNSIIRTTTVGKMDPIITDVNIGDSKIVLQSSYSDITTVASQFPMQHATQQLPNVNVSITTTDYSMESSSSITVIDSLVTTSGSADSSSISISSSQISLTEGLTYSVSSSSSSLVLTSSESSANASMTSDLHSFIYEPSVSESNSATGIVSSTTTSNVLLTSMDSSTLGVHKDAVTDSTMEVGIQASDSVAYVPSTGDLYSPVVPSKTVFTTGPVAIDSSTFKSTSAIPFSPTGKPVNTVDSGNTALFGGGFTDYILYIGVPVCGLVILIFFIVCIVCLRKRKNVNKGSPIKNHVQDLWVNSQQEIPLTRDPLHDPIREANGGESISGHRDLGWITLPRLKNVSYWIRPCYPHGLIPHDILTLPYVLRRRKKNTRIKIKGKNALDIISQTFETKEDTDIIPEPQDSTGFIFDDPEDSRKTKVNVDLNVEEALNDLDSALDDLDNVLDLDTALDDLDNILDLEDDGTDVNGNTAEFGDIRNRQCDEMDSDEGTLTGDEDDVAGDLSDNADGNTKECTKINGCTTYEAVFDFQAELETHLTLKQGDLVRVHRKEGSGWWRGTLGDKTGWFPNNYVQAAPQDKLETEDEIEMHSESNVSSFMVQPRHTPNLQDSLPSEKAIKAEPIYCKIQPKEQRKSFSNVPDKSPSKLAPSTRENGTTPLEEGSKFIVIYSSGGHFTGELTINKGDIIVGKELDNNGWMKGVNESTNQEGWCPTVYVDSLDKDEIKQLEPLTLPTSESQTSLSPDPLAYKQLESNTSSGDMKDWVGIVHKAVQPFNAEKAGDLAFEKGDLITVFQVLENGWWLGSKGKSVGWFPAPCVEMIPQPSPRLPSHRAAPSPSNASQTSNSPGSSEEGKTLTDDMNNTSPSKPSRLRPVRKAPPPPLRIDGNTDPKVSSPSSPRSVDGSESKIPTPLLNQTPKIPRAVRGTAPAPPVRDEPYDPLYDVVGKGEKTEHISGPILIQTTRDDGLYDLIQHTNGGEVDKKLNDGSKPDVPTRYIKPKLVTIPRSELNIPQTAPPNRGHGSPCISRPKVPPPPRPVGPPKVPVDDTKVEVDNKRSEIQQETFFHLPPQNRFDGIPRPESPEPDPVQSPFKGLSSFGSTFGKKEQKVENKECKVFENTFEKPIIINDNLGQLTEPNEGNTVDNRDTNIDNCAIKSAVDKEFDNQNMPKDYLVTPSVENNLINGGIREPGLYCAFAGESVKPETVNNVGSENVLENLNERSDSVTVDNVEDKPVKKKDKPISRIPPPKHISLKQSHAESEKPTMETKETVVAEKDTPKQTRIPMTRKDSPAKHPDRRKDSNSECETISDTLPIKNMNEKAKDINDSKINDSAVIDYTDITKGNSPQHSQQEVHDLENGDDAMRQRSESFNKPPVAPKPKAKGVPKLIKPGPGSKSPESPNDLQNHKADNTNKDKSDAFVCEDNENKVIENMDSKAKDSKIVSKLPKIAQKSPKVKKSGIPASPLMRMKNSVEKSSKPNKQPKLSESDSDAPMSPTTNPTSKVESPSMARRGAAKQVAESDKSIRNRSNSPHSRTGIPSSLKQRSNSPHSRTGIPSSLKQRSNSPASSELQKAPNSSVPSPGSPSPANTPTSVPKQSGLVPPKKITTPKGRHSPLSEPSSPISLTQSPDTSFDNTDDDQDGQVSSPKPDRPTKPPRLVKQKSQDGKAQKHGRSLLPIIHKSMDSGTNGTIVNKPPKSGIPLSKSLRPPASKTTTEDVGNRGPTLFQAVRGYTAQTDEELSFAEGTFVTELSDCDRVGWFVGMLADGTTGLYQADFFTPRPLDQQQSEA